MASIRDLTQTLASALGIEPEVVKGHAHALCEAELFPGDDVDRAYPEHAAALLICLMSGVSPDKAPDAVRLYGGLPLDCIHRGVTRPDGTWEGGLVSGDDPLMEAFEALGSNFAEVLAAFIAWFNETPEIDYKVINFTMGGASGTASAVIYLTVFIEGEEVMGDVKFSLVPLGGGDLPDDAPRARLERQAIIPGAILPILRECFTSSTGGPREVFISRAAAL